MKSNADEWMDPADFILDTSKKNTVFRKRNKVTPEIRAVYDQFILTAVSLDNSRIRRIPDESNVFGLPKMMMRKDLISDVLCMQIINYLHNLTGDRTAIRLVNGIDALHTVDDGTCKLVFACKDDDGRTFIGDRELTSSTPDVNTSVKAPMKQPLPQQVVPPIPSYGNVPGFNSWQDPSIPEDANINELGPLPRPRI